MTTFNVRIPGLRFTIVQADGQNVMPVEIDEFQIGVAETYDAIVTPTEDKAFTLVGEAIDRSGMARATLAPRAGMTALVPPLRPRPIATRSEEHTSELQSLMRRSYAVLCLQKTNNKD